MNIDVRKNINKAGKESAYNVGDLGLIPGLGRFPGTPWRSAWQPTPVFLPG